MQYRYYSFGKAGSNLTLEFEQVNYTSNAFVVYVGQADDQTKCPYTTNYFRKFTAADWNDNGSELYWYCYLH